MMQKESYLKTNGTSSLKKIGGVRIKQIKQNVHSVLFDDNKKLFLIGTAHVSADSVKLVEDTIGDIKPDAVAIELDEQRYKSITNSETYKNIDIVQIIKKKQLFFFIGQFVMASFQKKISEKTGSTPGLEFKKAAELAEQIGARLVLADRNIGVTLKRAFRLTPFRHKIKFLAGLLLAGDDEDIDAASIEELKTGDMLESVVKSFEDELPITKQVLIDERDEYLAREIKANLGAVTVAVVGAGHVSGILKCLQNNEPANNWQKEKLNEVPAPSKVGKILPWIIPAVVIGVIVWGFFNGNREAAEGAILYWILINGSFAAIGCIIALAHPLTVVAGFVAAPITSLNPTIGAGFVTAIVQTLLVKPRVMDFEEIQNRALSVKKWWSNRITRIFLVFICSSIGSAIGTFAALPALRKIF